MKGKKTSIELVDEIRKLRSTHSPPEIVKLMEDRLNRRTVYRILGRLKKEDERKAQEFEEQIRKEFEKEEQIREERARKVGWQRFVSGTQLPPNLRRVYS